MSCAKKSWKHISKRIDISLCESKMLNVMFIQYLKLLYLPLKTISLSLVVQTSHWEKHILHSSVYLFMDTRDSVLYI